MRVKIVTDSGSDISPEDARELGIAIVPTYVRFGDKIYRDRVDIDVDEFYMKLATSPVHPTTAAPSPGDFVKVYRDLYRETDEIVSIHITKKHSAVLDSALLGKEMAQKKGCHIEVVDSGGVTLWQGLVAIAAAKAAASGYNLSQVIAEVHETIGNLKGLALLSTLKYVTKGGRLAGTLLKVESLLNVKAMLTIKDGEVRPAGLVRSWAKGVEKLNEFVKSAISNNVQEIAVAYNTNQNDTNNLIALIKSIAPSIIPRIGRLGPTLGVHTGPGTIAAAAVETSK